MDKEELKIASSMVKPIYGLSFFSVGYRDIIYSIVFDYMDPAGYYRKISQNQDLLYDEINTLYSNMQNILNRETVRINGKDVRSTVINVDIGFRSSYIYPYIVFNIMIECTFRKGRNIYENFYEDTIAEYPYTSYWIFPKGVKILDIEMSGEIFISNNVLGVRVSKGEKIQGYEKIVFTL